MSHINLIPATSNPQPRCLRINFRRSWLPLALCLACFFPGINFAQQPCTVEASISVVIRPVPVAGFTVSANGLAVTFQNTSTNATGYLWDFGDGQISTEPNPLHNYSTPGLYTVLFTATNDCGAATLQLTFTVMSTGVFETPAGREVKIYPNPVSGEASAFVLDLRGFESEAFDVVVTDLAGRAVFRKPFDNFSEKTILKMGDLPAGGYFVQVWQRGKIEGVARLLRL